MAHRVIIKKLIFVRHTKINLLYIYTMYGHNPPAETIILLINSRLSKYLPLPIYSSGFATDLVNNDSEIVGQKEKKNF